MLLTTELDLSHGTGGEAGEWLLETSICSIQIPILSPTWSADAVMPKRLREQQNTFTYSQHSGQDVVQGS